MCHSQATNITLGTTHSFVLTYKLMLSSVLIGSVSPSQVWVQHFSILHGSRSQLSNGNNKDNNNNKKQHHPAKQLNLVELLLQH